MNPSRKEPPRMADLSVGYCSPVSVRRTRIVEVPADRLGQKCRLCRSLLRRRGLSYQSHACLGQVGCSFKTFNMSLFCLQCYPLSIGSTSAGCHSCLLFLSRSAYAAKYGLHCGKHTASVSLEIHAENWIQGWKGTYREDIQTDSPHYARTMSRT